ncbi:DUF1598 domain-containing protein [Aporhodopirellula aestuarii]|uniref:DUF1598 domain-containing protein n=1 Tax=Aporhodopirellula aestuarii TaxID=2950107 RepID=A0ABT0TZP0_9BACT|nr:DUF1598 domain-containing protein [Aporhodopirellula aestuarii]MCM2370032.1 DUF1598 domain-containing protein [Aporhodopirellula aestuarii]
MRLSSAGGVMLVFATVCLWPLQWVDAQQPGFSGQFGGQQAGGEVFPGANPGAGGQDQAGGNNAQGGGSMADFDSLMTLIQQTVEPDSWEALGGVGTMAPYPQGVMVDPRGLLKDYERPSGKKSDHATAIAGMLAPARPDVGRDVGNQDDWRLPAQARCVSMRRMMQALATRSLLKQNRSQNDGEGFVSSESPQADEDLEAFRAMAGLSRVTLVMVTSDDLILAGPVAGFEEVDGWEVDRATGLPPMSLVSMAVGLQAARSGVPYGCTIDPTPDGLRAAAALGQRIVSGEVPMGLAADSLAAALGRQNIIVFGTTPSHEVAYLMVEADRHMKRLALGSEPMPERVRNYLQLMSSTGDGTPPTDLLLRLWFTSRAIDLRATDVDGDKIIQIAGTPIRLSGENERAQLDGARGNRVIDDASLAFVDHFNQNWGGIRAKYPLYGALESVYTATAIAELWKRMAATSDHETLQRAVMYFAADQAEKLQPPTQVDSIAVLHRYRKGKKQHQVLMASGGVKIDSDELLPLRTMDYPGLKAYANLRDQRPTNRWWWNGQIAKQ